MDQKAVGERLKEEIKQSPLGSQVRLAERLGIKETTVSQYVNGHQMPALARWVEIVNILETADLHYILMGERREGAGDALLEVLRGTFGVTLSEAELLTRLAVHQSVLRERGDS